MAKQRVSPLTETAEGLDLAPTGVTSAGGVLASIIVIAVLVLLVAPLFFVHKMLVVLLVGPSALVLVVTLVFVRMVMPRSSVLRRDGTLHQVSFRRKRSVVSVGAPTNVQMKETWIEGQVLYGISLKGSTGDLELCVPVNRNTAELWAAQIARFLGVEVQSLPVPTR